MTSPQWRLLAIIDGETEARYTEPPDTAHNSGIVYRLIAALYDEDTAQHTRYIYWRQWKQLLARSKSPKRGISPSPKGYREQARQAAIHAREVTTHRALILLVDRDHKPDEARLDDIRQGVAAASMTDRCATGEAIEDAEAWLLADPSLLASPLPRRCEDLWGDRDDPQSNHPKQALKRCVLTPQRWTFEEVVERWDFHTAQRHAPSLRAFLDALNRMGHAAALLG